MTKPDIHFPFQIAVHPNFIVSPPNIIYTSIIIILFHFYSTEGKNPYRNNINVNNNFLIYALGARLQILKICLNLICDIL